MSEAPNKGKSPYQKYGKRPHRYSDELENWTAAVKSGDRGKADFFDRKWRRKFGVHLREYNE